jgi:hypothetical protein
MMVKKLVVAAMVSIVVLFGSCSRSTGGGTNDTAMDGWKKPDG